jgi:hypothetical protein
VRRVSMAPAAWQRVLTVAWCVVMCRSCKVAECFQQRGRECPRHGQLVRVPLLTACNISGKPVFGVVFGAR